MKEEIKKHHSKKSYESDPALKDLAFTLQDKSYKLRKEGIIDSDSSLTFEKSYLTNDEISRFAKAAGNLPKLKLDHRNSLKKIAQTFSKAFSSQACYEEANGQVQEILIESFFQTAKALAVAVETRDPYTGGHSDRVFQIATILGKRCNISTTEQLYLEAGALLHDVGKIGIRDGVLLKPGPLTDSEYQEMQLHSIIGAHMVEKLNCLHGCIDVVLFHHERIDGYGYPYGIKGNEIPIIARITSIADAYDAMTTNRVYRKALSHEHAIEEIIRNSGTQFDPEIVRIFIQWWEETFQKDTDKKQKIA
ncbi:MAG: hypothetical protein A3I68_01375 [Candidatus Melainabacteria bacterium RIFCSPLOWO2_02_FULL_35_15]|nr:MAG: hypothetical protein A3F80_01405 [Candidatus Melainabacteria bacterium RIFCSPLOWO2_12_FULL_35_11]OGI12965.1 MAG: hypothetical protein A3I68_01375 [Candidatus Melainabacteria bacterium RIFCSPLOWO2_02_FULL_35_15]